MLLWLDMEMTGLDVEKEVPIEVACIVTDWNFQTLTHYHAIIRQPQEFLDRMDDWNKEHHKESGLDGSSSAKAQKSSPAQVEQELCEVGHFAFWHGKTDSGWKFDRPRSIVHQQVLSKTGERAPCSITGMLDVSHMENCFQQSLLCGKVLQKAKSSGAGRRSGEHRRAQILPPAR